MVQTMINTKGDDGANIIGNAGEMDDEMETMGMASLNLGGKM